ncbi:MAG: hypothetical protein ABI378_06380, partial [Chitinophagaceae bacterium]
MFTKKLVASLSIAALILGFFSFSACRKNNVGSDEDTGYASDHATLEKTYSDVQSIADEAGTDGTMSNYKVIPNATILSQCATVTRDTSVSPHVLTINFGTTNCLCKDGIYRRGEIIVTYAGGYREMGHTHSITFSNYFQNDNQVMGTKTVTYANNDSLGIPEYDIVINGQIILANNAGTISWVSTRTRHWIAGFNTPQWNDD